MRYVITVLLFFSSLFLSSCAELDGVTVIEGFVSAPPLHPLQNSDTVMIRFAGEIFSSVNSSMIGRIQRDSDEVYNKFQWSHPRIAIGGDIEIYISRNVAKRGLLSMGLTTGYTGKQSYTMVRFGCAYERNNAIVGTRLDIGFCSATIYSERYPFWGDSPYPYNPFNPLSKRSSTENKLGQYASLTLGIHQPESKWNYNLQIAYSWQKVSGVAGLFGSANGEPPTGAYFIHVNPFISYRISNKSRIVMGLRMIRETDIEDTNGLFLVLPFISMNLISNLISLDSGSFENC